MGCALCSGVVLWVMNRRKKGPLSTLDAVGGHGSKSNKGPAIRLSNDGKEILKPFQPAQGKGKKSRGEIEVEFYQTIQSHPLKKVTPKFHGVVNQDGETYLSLENLTHGMLEPCVLDLKMGTQTYDENATPEKIAREKKKYPPQEKIGFRIVGMKTKHGNEWWKSSRDWCMDITEDTMTSALREFFTDGVSVRNAVVDKVLEQLNDIETILSVASTWRMYGSSLLIVFDAANLSSVTVKMIDFAHVFPIQEYGGKDHGYLDGLMFLRHSLKTINASQQVGGAHGNISSSGGRLTKKEDKPEQFDNEVSFYQTVCEQEDSIAKTMPTLVEVKKDISPREMVISDASALVSNGSSVSIMDIKLGKRSFSAECENIPKDSYFNKYATFEKDLASRTVERIWKTLGYGKTDGPPSLKGGKLGKRDYLSFRDATTTSHELAFRLTALKHGDYKVTQSDSRSIETRVQFIDCLERYLTGSNGFNTHLAHQFLEQLSDISVAITQSKVFPKYEMIGTSLLFLHSDGKAAIRWIDFANSIPCEHKNDFNQIPTGINYLQLAIEELVNKFAY